MKKAYIEKKFTAESHLKIEQANEIIDEFQEQGLTLTLRQLYYQFVSKDLIPNNIREYKKLGDLISNARMAGYIDWDAIEDRTRALEKQSAWASPNEILDVVGNQYQIDLWKNQANHVEVWVEKEALAGVVERACEEYRIPYFCCRGYASASSIYEAAQRFTRAIKNNKTVHVLHLGDHDPSGIDMSRDNLERIREMIQGNGQWMGDFELHRLALNMDQVRKYRPPANPAKATDIRFQGYAEKFGTESWELDALNPKIILSLVHDQAEELIDFETWNDDKKRESYERSGLKKLAEEYQA